MRLRTQKNSLTIFEYVGKNSYLCTQHNKKQMKLIADSGSTKTDWCLTEGGQTVRLMATQGMNPFHMGEGEIYEILTGELRPQLGGAEPAEVYFYGSGCRDACLTLMETMLRRVFAKAGTVCVGSDLLGAARALCARSGGIACILGTGSNSCLYNGESIVENTPPLGYILGDEGSGAVLGRCFAAALLRGLLPQALADAFAKETGLTAAEIIRRVYREPGANRFLASLTRFIHRHIDSPELRRLAIDNFRSFFRLHVAPYRRPDLPVGVIGSVGYYFSAELSDAAEAEGITLGTVERSPLERLAAYHG